MILSKNSPPQTPNLKLQTPCPPIILFSIILLNLSLSHLRSSAAKIILWKPSFRPQNWHYCAYDWHNR